MAIHNKQSNDLSFYAREKKWSLEGKEKRLDNP
jgi:hypothetical protein